MRPIVALVAADHELVRYLEDVGFDVRAVESPLHAPREGTLVWLTEPDFDERLVIDTLRMWLGANLNARVVLVSDRPTRLKDACQDRSRVILLAAPVFGWQLVDAIRDSTPSQR